MRDATPLNRLFEPADVEELLQAMQQLAWARTQASVLGVVRSAARTLTSADGVTFVLREGGFVHYVEENAIGPLWKGRRFPMSECISGWVISQGASAAIENVFVDPRIPVEAYRPTFVKSLAMVPVRRQEPLGALGAYWASHHVATERELTLLQLLADAAAIAVDNARLNASEQAARERAEHEGRLREELIKVVSHDLRTPLTSLATSASVLLPLVAPLNGRASRHVDLILRSVRRMESMIHDLLDHAALEGRQISLQLEPVSVRALLDALVELRPLALEKELELQVTEPLPSAITRCDPERVFQVFSNLITNAIRHTPRGGRINVSVSEREGGVQFEVADSGPGIAPELLPMLFDRARRTTSHRGDGLGLGLSIASGIVALHGGKLTAENALTGALFRFTLPTVRVVQPARTQTAALPA